MLQLSNVDSIICPTLGEHLRSYSLSHLEGELSGEPPPITPDFLALLYNIASHVHLQGMGHDSYSSHRNMARERPRAPPHNEPPAPQAT